MAISTEKVGARIYVVGDAYAVRSALKSAGCHWDSARKQWWIGSTKATEIIEIVERLDGQPAAKEDLSTKNVYGKVEYKGRTYYIIARSDKTSKFWLTVLDGSIDFWAAMSECRIIKTYQARENYRTGRQDYQTLGSLRRFMEDSKNAKKEGYSDVGEMRAEKSGRCRGCGRPITNSPHHKAMGGYCGDCAFDEFDC